MLQRGAVGVAGIGVAGLAGAILSLGACTRPPAADTAAAVPRAAEGAMHNHLTDAERAAGWRLLYDGRSTSGWRVYRGQSEPGGWSGSTGELTKAQITDDIITRDQFGDFELAFDWKLSRGGNAGVFYRANEQYEKVYWSAPEYQLLDDAHGAGGNDPLTAAGAAYGLYPAPRGHARPAGEWNTARIVVRGPRVEHWLNGVQLLSYELWSPEWNAKVKGSKFGEWPNFGRAERGHIAIQGDHAGVLALRNVRIREFSR